MSWYGERLYGDWRTSYRVRRAILRQRTRFQRMAILDTGRCGRMLVLDGIVQTCELDEFIYHEMLVHVPMVSHGGCRRVLIIGGGDGGALREVLRHPVERAVLVEIDSEVVRACRRHLPSLSAGAFDDERAEVVFEDGARFVKGTGERFDAVIVDSPDPVGAAEVLFGTRFYRDVFRVLRPGGVAARQSGAVMLQPSELAAATARMRKVFRHVGVFLAAVPTYAGGFFSFVMGSRCADAFGVSANRVEERLRKIGLKTRYYNAEIHRACFALPNYVKELAR